MHTPNLAIPGLEHSHVEVVHMPGPEYQQVVHCYSFPRRTDIALVCSMRVLDIEIVLQHWFRWQENREYIRYTIERSRLLNADDVESKEIRPLIYRSLIYILGKLGNKTPCRKS